MKSGRRAGSLVCVQGEISLRKHDCVCVPAGIPVRKTALLSCVQGMLVLQALALS